MNDSIPQNIVMDLNRVMEIPMRQEYFTRGYY